MISKGNFYSLMFFVLALGVFVCYFAMGWTTNTIAQVNLAPNLILEVPDLTRHRASITSSVSRLSTISSDKTSNSSTAERTTPVLWPASLNPTRSPSWSSWVSTLASS